MVIIIRKVDLSFYNIRTDLISDIAVDKNTVSYKNKSIKVSRYFIDDKLSKKLKKEKGEYLTIYFKDISDITSYNNLFSIFKKEFKNMLKEYNLDNILIIGLGNIKSTPDSLGPRVIDLIKSTRHIKELMGSLEKGFKTVSKISPGVMGETGIETIDIIRGVVDNIKPSLLIVIDALASSNVDRLCKTIQITNTGVSLGSGVKNNRGRIDYDTYKIPVLAIGVPTVLYASTIIYDALSFYDKKLIKDITKNIDENLIVTPKDIDFDINNLSKLISDIINLSIHIGLNDKKV